MKNILNTVRVVTIGGVMGVALAACAGDPAPYAAAAPGSQNDPFAADAIASGDYMAAAKMLESHADQGPLTKLNLALAYSKTGRVDEAMRLYQSILAARENPYAVIDENGAPMRVKTIAEKAVTRLQARLESADSGRGR